MKEQTKADNRRRSETIDTINWVDLLYGKTCIDIGCGDNPISFPQMEVTRFDMEQGDATKLDDYFPENHFEVINASQVIEDFDNLPEALWRITKCLKPGGIFIITVPDFVLYEQLQWPPVYNQGHRNTFSLYLPFSPAGENHWHIGGDRWNSMLEGLGLKTKLQRLVDTNYDYSKLGNREDQTLKFEDGVECSIEIVLKKLQK
jgi:SAM-dependent methyltransferase